MMEAWTHELRLALILLLNTVVFAAAYRFARRQGGGGGLQTACDAFLIYFVVEYVSVALPGALGTFNLWTMSLVALTASAALWLAPDRSTTASDERAGAPWTADHFGLVACGIFVVSYIAEHVFDGRWNPPTVTDALVYHLPTAAQWIQTGKLGLFPTWYWNPAATYSPATSSTFMAWLMAPAGNDLFVRFVQAPALVFVFLLVARLCREFGCGRTVAGLVGVAAAMSRPFMSEALFPKDDLFVTAFFGAAALSLTPANLRDRLGPWRAGLALGMVLACKYTVLLVCPLLLFLIDAPFRARWRVRHWLIAIVTALVLSAPWYIRNVILTGNPLFPVDVKIFGTTVFEGLFGTERDQQLRTAGGVWKMLGQTYHSVPAILLVALGVAWIAGLAGAARCVLRDPLRRACLLGTAVTFMLFVVTSPHHEVRYMYPLLLLIFAVCGFSIVRWIKSPAAGVGTAASLAVLALGTAFETGLLSRISGLFFQAAIATAISIAAVIAQTRWLKLRPSVVVLIAFIVIFMPAYIYWSSFVNTYYRKASDGGGESGISYAWRGQYPDEEPLWTFVRENVPDDATIAIANTFFAYPFQDAHYHRRLGYAPVLRGLHEFRDFPRMGERVPGDEIVQRMTDVMNADPDKATWLENLRRMNAQYLVIASLKHEPNPPERRFVADEPGRFEKLFDNPSGVVYRIR